MNIKKNKKSFISIYKLKIFYFLKNKLTYLYKKDLNCKNILDLYTYIKYYFTYIIRIK